MKLNNNFQDKINKEIAYDMGSISIPGKIIKMVKLLKEEDPKHYSSKMVTETNKQRITIREYFEKEGYPDTSKIRIKSLRKMLALLIGLKETLREMYPNDIGRVLMSRIRDLNVNDIPKEILDVLDISKRTLYDYLNALQMILDYSDY